jgi:trans-2,3-dihydro-3-hydroxyanthranilate isomerase
VAAHPFYLVDVFAERPLEGNQLAVVLEADDVNDAVMLRVARELSLAETSFVQSSEVADYRNRIWTVVEEVPFAGHPSLGAAVAVASSRQQGRGELRQETASGINPVRVSDEGTWWSASILQAAATEHGALAFDEILPALGLPPEAGAAGLHPTFVTTGLPVLIVPVSSPGYVAAARPDRERIAALPRPIGAFNLYLVSFDSDRALARARSFPCHPEEAEDAATGSAAGALCAYAHARFGLDSLDVVQGVEIGRPSRLRCCMELGRPRVAGAVRVLVRGSIEL